jgi:hypothetical protein
VLRVPSVAGLVGHALIIDARPCACKRVDAFFFVLDSRCPTD